MLHFRLIFSCVFLLFLFTTPTVIGQTSISCFWDSEEQIEPMGSNDCNFFTLWDLDKHWYLKYNRLDTWIANDSTPTKTIMMNIVVCQDSQGGNAWQDTPAFHNHVEQMEDSLNMWFGYLPDRSYPLACDPMIPQVQDSKIRIEIENVYFLQNNDFNQLAISAGSSYMNPLLSDLYSQFPEARQNLNYIFTQPDSANPYGAWGRWGWSADHKQHFIHTERAMGSWLLNPDLIGHWAHEFGHGLSLGHTYSPGEDDLAVVSHSQNPAFQGYNQDFMSDLFGLCADPIFTDSISPCFDPTCESTLPNSDFYKICA